MAMSERQIQKEILRLKKDIDHIENQIQTGMKSKAEKEQENARLADDMAKQEDENKVLESELQKQEASISELDEEFKENQLKAGRIRKEMNLLLEELEKKEKQDKQLRENIEFLINKLESSKKKIKEEKRSREQAEYNLRKTNAKVAEIQSHWASKPVTGKIARDAKREGRKVDEIQRSQEDIDAYEAAVKESQLAKVGKPSAQSGNEESTDEAVGLVEDTPEVVEEKKEETGLDLDY